MTDIIKVCPAHPDDHGVVVYRPRLDRWYCADCHDTHDDCAERESRYTAPHVGGLSPLGKRLLDMDPDEVP